MYAYDPKRTSNPPARAVAPGVASSPSGRTGRSILDLHQSVGNRAVQRLVQAGAVQGSPSALIQRQPRPGPRRADRFLPAERARLRTLGRGELDELIDQIIADGQYHPVRKEKIGEVEHTWVVKTEIVELTEEEQLKGATFGGALSPDKTTPSSDGKQMRHEVTFVLRGGQASTIESALHELIHLRIAIDRVLPAEERSSFFSEYNELNEMTEVMSAAKFGDGSNIDQKSSFGALPLVAGTWEKLKIVLRKMEAIRGFFISQDANAASTFDSDALLTPAALIEFITQEKYVTQAAARAASASGNAPGNETVANRYARAVVGRFEGLVSEAARQRIGSSAVGRDKRKDLTDELSLSMRRLYDELDQLIKQAQSFQKNPPAPPANMPDPMMFQWRPLGLDGQPIPAPAELSETK